MIVAVTNQKGGTGKTTTAVSLAACLAAKGRRVLLVDLDPQASASQWLRVGDGGKALLRVLTDLDPIRDCITSTDVAGLDIVPGGGWTAYAESRLASEQVKEHPAALRLREALARVNTYDEIVIDTPPTLGFLSSNGIHAADMILIPVEAHVMTMQAVPRLLASLVEWNIGDRRHIVPVRVDGRNRHTGEVVERLRELYGSVVTRTIIRENIRIAEAWGFGKPVTAYDPLSAGALDYTALTTELYGGT